MAEAIPGAELLEIPNASHTAPIERPHLVDWTIRDFSRADRPTCPATFLAFDDLAPRE